MQFINTKILLSILALVTVIAGIAVKWDVDNRNVIEQAEIIQLQVDAAWQKRKSNVIEIDPSKMPPSTTADNLF